MIVTLLSFNKVFADCIQDEIQNQIYDMEHYTSPKVWEALKNTPVPSQLKALSSNKTELEKLLKEIEPMTTRLEKSLDNKEAQKSFLATENQKLQQQGSIAVWEMIIMESAIRCIKAGRID